MPVTSLPVDQFIMTKFASSSCETSDFDPKSGIRLVSGLNNMSRCLPSYLKFCHSFKELKLSVPLSNPEHTPTANTVNGKKLGTVFAKTLCKYSAIVLDSASAFYHYAGPLAFRP